MRWTSDLIPRLYVAAAVLMAVGPHVQPTLTLGETAVRFSLSDVFGLLLAPFACWLMYQNLSLFKQYEVRVACILMALATLVMSYGLVIGANSVGSYTTWALVKYSGWFVLLAYLLFGLILPYYKPEAVIRVFILVSVAIHLGLVVTYIVLASFGVPWYGESSPRLSGLITNPNAYGLSLLCILSLLLASGARIMLRIPSSAWEWIAGSLVAGVLFTRSLAALGAMAIMLSIWLISRKKFWALLRIILISAVLYGLPIVGVKLYVSHGGKTASDSVSRHIVDKLTNPDDYAFSLQTRTDSYIRAIEMWQAAPVFGAGLGVFYDKERKLAAPKRPALQIHNTALWMLVEFGVFGLSMFVILIIGVAVFLYRSFCQFRDHEPLVGDLALAGLMILPVWATMSLAHEMMYQRVPWFILGLCAGATFLTGSEQRKA